MQHGGWMAEPRRCSADLKEQDRTTIRRLEQAEASWIVAASRI